MVVPSCMAIPPFLEMGLERGKARLVKGAYWLIPEREDVVVFGITSLIMPIPIHRCMDCISIKASSIAASLSDYHCRIRRIRRIKA